MRVFVLAALAVMFWNAVASAASPGEALPPSKRDCLNCHTLSADGSLVRLRAPVIELCLGCHPDRATSADHRVGIEPAMPVRSLPLEEGRMTCATCHEPHGLTGRPLLLRADPADLCLFCHIR
jgi:predicted CXXCH cytochrome family protein